MTDAPRLYLITPVVTDADAFAPILTAACAGGEVAAVMLRLAGRDQRALVKQVKQLAPLAQDQGAAVVIAGDFPHDAIEELAQVAIRGGADGAHMRGADADVLRAATGALQPDRILGVGGVFSRHEAMLAGESNADYVMFGEPDVVATEIVHAGDNLDEDDDDAPADEAARTLAHAEWWASLFGTPCVACANSLDEVGPLAAVGVEFVALGPWAFEADNCAAVIETALTLIAEATPVEEAAG